MKRAATPAAAGEFGYTTGFPRDRYSVAALERWRADALSMPAANCGHAPHGLAGVRGVGDPSITCRTEPNLTNGGSCCWA